MAAARLLKTLLLVALLVSGSAGTAIADPYEPGFDGSFSGEVGVQANEYVQLSSAYSNDLNGDGWPDLLSRNSATGDLLVYPHTRTGTGTGTFSGPFLVGVGWNMMNWIGVAEFSGDDYPDLLARRASDGALLVYVHSGALNGMSTFQGPFQIGSGWNLFRKILLSDVSNDGFEDLVGIDSDGYSWIYPHSGFLNGHSTAGGPVKAGQYQFDDYILTPEWTGDISSDLVRHSFGRGNLVRQDARGDLSGDSTWTRAGSGVVVSGTQFAFQSVNLLSVCDVNGDGWDDVIARDLDGTLRFYASNRAGAVEGGSTVIGSGWQIMDIIT
ncbi:FG-GAP-like repeat-containing protein [Lentzea cavernae]|uniref:Repeat domain-containing protein n=1 Tax=Lentzea cavernae TaxID=2020703 RepID=A0ABQ3M445_9PSEU|nr:FG-GAP-like repeat-containing protein [Lentzea cavernae]GHH32523.1 hypothetical protein GCM10017774_13560 [Lentzea cavernae]